MEIKNNSTALHRSVRAGARSEWSLLWFLFKMNLNQDDCTDFSNFRLVFNQMKIWHSVITANNSANIFLRKVMEMEPNVAGVPHEHHLVQGVLLVKWQGPLHPIDVATASKPVFWFWPCPKLPLMPMGTPCATESFIQAVKSKYFQNVDLGRSCDNSHLGLCAEALEFHLEYRMSPINPSLKIPLWKEDYCTYAVFASFFPYPFNASGIEFH